MRPIEQEIRGARDLTMTTSACRRSSAPARNSPKNVPSDAAKTGKKAISDIKNGKHHLLLSKMTNSLRRNGQNCNQTPSSFGTN